MTLPKTASNKTGILIKMKDLERLDTLLRKVALPISRVLDSGSMDENGNVMISEKVALDTDKAWEAFKDAYRKITLKKIKNMLDGRGESKSRKPGVETNGEGSTSGS